MGPVQRRPIGTLKPSLTLAGRPHPERNAPGAPYLDGRGDETHAHAAVCEGWARWPGCGQAGPFHAPEVAVPLTSRMRLGRFPDF